MMGTNQNGKRFYQVKIKGLDVTSLKELGRLMGPLQRQAFRKAHENLLDLTIPEVFPQAVVSLTQYYDQPLSYSTFGKRTTPKISKASISANRTHSSWFAISLALPSKYFHGRPTTPFQVCFTRSNSLAESLTTTAILLKEGRNPREKIWFPSPKRTS